MARKSGIEVSDGVTLGDVRRWVEEVDLLKLPDNVLLFGSVSFKGKVTKMHAQEDKIKTEPVS